MTGCHIKGPRRFGDIPGQDHLVSGFCGVHDVETEFGACSHVSSTPAGYLLLQPDNVVHFC